MPVTPKVEADPGFGIVADAFAANLQRHGEVGAAYLYQDGRVVAEGWGDTTWVPVSGEPVRSMNAPDGSGLGITDPRYARYAKEVGYA